MNWKILACSLLVALPVWAHDFKAANQLYDAGKFAEAAAAYEKIESKTAHVFYNLGNARFRQDKLGLAILSYERARRLAPHDPDILANLRFAQLKLGVDEMNTPSKAWQKLLRSAIESRTIAEWSVYELAGLWLTALAIGVCIYFPRLRTGMLIVSVVSFVGFTIATLALIIGRRTPEAIVTAADAEARFAPVPDSTVHFRLAEGTKVAIREDRGQWFFVERTDGQQGWVKTDVVGRITVQ